MKKKTPTLSIITICYNIKDEIERTCESIVNQTWQDFEWIVVDGGSTDGTVDILKRYQDRMSVFISEKDKGVYNAMNKGIKRACGKWLHFLNGGDCYTDNSILEKVFADKKYDADVLYGDMNLMRKNKFLRRVTFTDAVDKSFFYKNYIAHPSSFIKRELFDKYGLYNENYRIVSDWEKWVIFSGHGVIFQHIDRIISDFDDGGISGTNFELSRKERNDVISTYYSDKEIQQIKNRKKIIVVGLSKVATVTGGAITVFGDFCNAMAKDFDVVACWYSSVNAYPQYLKEGITSANLYYKYKGFSFSQALNTLVDEEKADLVVFFFPHDYVNVKWTPKNEAIPKILMFHSRPDHYFQSEFVKNGLQEHYKNTIAQILLPSYYSLLPDYIKKSQVVCIPNTIKTENNPKDEKTEQKKMVYLSRIDSGKGHDFLINAFALISKKYPDWQLDIYGQSEPPVYEKILKEKVKQLNLERQIHFMGITKEPLRVLQNYDFCVFPSLFEGFPMGLVEAQSVGLSAIGLKGCSGVNELIVDGKNGLLADDNIQDFAAKIEMMIKDKTLRKKMAKEAYLSTLQYNKENVYKKWTDVVSAVIAGKKIPHTITEKIKAPYQIFPLSKIADIKRNIEIEIKKYKEPRIIRYYLFDFIPLLSIEEK
ncbi:MAG: glycosyltransferase [Alphaproteobacteria bacterium]|nr:glycosyltransferase [Alphaproteobacteria bacterium]